MLTAADIIPLPCTPDLIDAGLIYACRSLALSRTKKHEPTRQNVQRISASAVVNLSVRRCLQDQAIHFSTALTLFTNTDRYDLLLAGKRCEVVSYWISQREPLVRLQRDISILLQSPALIASDDFAAEYHRADDLYLFTFLLGSDTPTTSPATWMHLFSKEWSRPDHRWPFRGLVFRNESAEPLAMELGGLDRQHGFQCISLNLPPGEPVPVEIPFHSLAYLKAHQRPANTIRLCSQANQVYLITPTGWARVDFDGTEILLAGWLSHEEFRQRAQFVAIGTRTFQYGQTRVKNLAVPLDRLKTVVSLLEEARKEN